ncbi:hypothetical protein J7L13_02410 [bacterium]|nr:hypothetical protein [bacterium]
MQQELYKNCSKHKAIDESPAETFKNATVNSNNKSPKGGKTTQINPRRRNKKNVFSSEKEQCKVSLQLIPVYCDTEFSVKFS